MMKKARYKDVAFCKKNTHFRDECFCLLHCPHQHFLHFIIWGWYEKNVGYIQQTNYMKTSFYPQMQKPTYKIRSLLVVGHNRYITLLIVMPVGMSDFAVPHKILCHKVLCSLTTANLLAFLCLLRLHTEFSPCPFLLPISSFLNTTPPLGMHRSSQSSFSFSSKICSSVSPCMLGGRVAP